MAPDQYPDPLDPTPDDGPLSVAEPDIPPLDEKYDTPHRRSSDRVLGDKAPRTRLETVFSICLMVATVAMAVMCLFIVTRRSTTVEHIDCYEAVKVPYQIALGDFVLDASDGDRVIKPETITAMNAATENYRNIKTICPTSNP